MGVFHYKAILIESDENRAVYRFYPDYIASEKIAGEFELDAKDWKPSIKIGAEIPEMNSVDCNERPVDTLTYKIKKHFEANGKLAAEIFHLA